MQITVFGASGRVGQRVVELALKHGHTVVAFVHSKDPFTGTPHLMVKKGDIHDAAAVAEAMQGSEAVISTLGSWGTKTHDIVSGAMKTIIPAMEQQGIKRLITLTGSGALTPDRKQTAGHKLFLDILSMFPAGKVFRDGEEHMRLLAASDLNWTTIRSPIMTSASSEKYRLVSKTGPLATIGRQAVTVCLVDQLSFSEHLRQAPTISK